ncbi:MAG: hypothetical protein KDD02_16555 [Phaeodactylibacter sp.]|nr:hypothetical protein [Phaeodactylibacter sp.]
MNIVNLTPHTLNFYRNNGSGLVPFTSIPSSGFARAKMEEQIIEEVEIKPTFKVDVVKKTFGDAEGVPASQKDTIYIVSALTAQAPNLQGRDDIYVVGQTVRENEETGELSDDSKARGKIVGCTGLAKI